MQFPIQPGTHRNLADGLRWWLEMYAVEYKYRHPGLPYSSTEEFILREAIPTPAMLDYMGGVPDMPVGKCFNNAWQLSQQNHRYVYFEGWAIMDHGLPAHHAWLWDTRDRKVEDPTWRGLYASRRVRYANEPWTGCAVYWGVPIHPEDHLQWVLNRWHPNLLAVNDDDYLDVLHAGAGAFGSRPALDHNPPVVL